QGRRGRKNRHGEALSGVRPVVPQVRDRAAKHKMVWSLAPGGRPGEARAAGRGKLRPTFLFRTRPGVTFPTTSRHFPTKRKMSGSTQLPIFKGVMSRFLSSSHHSQHIFI